MAGVKFLDGTRRYGTMSFFFTSCRDSSFCAQQNGTVNVMPKIGNFLSWKWGYAARVEDVR